MTIIYIFYVDNFSTCSFNLDSHKNNHIFIMLLRIIVYFLIFIYHVFITSYLIILKINVSTYQIRIVLDTRIVSVYHRWQTNVVNNSVMFRG